RPPPTTITSAHRFVSFDDCMTVCSCRRTRDISRGDRLRDGFVTSDPDRGHDSRWIARRSRLWVILRTRSSGPWGRDRRDQGRAWRGGDERPCAQKIVEALKTKFPFGPG